MPSVVQGLAERPVAVAAEEISKLLCTYCKMTMELFSSLSPGRPRVVRMPTHRSCTMYIFSPYIAFHCIFAIVTLRLQNLMHHPARKHKQSPPS